MRRSSLRILALLLPFALGCATHADKLKDIRATYHSGNLGSTHAQLDAAIAKKGRDADVLKLDKATALLSEGKPREAEVLFRELRDKFDALDGKDAQEQIASMLTDDQRLAYAGEDHEKVLIRFYLSLCNLLQNGSDASAYALQVNQKQQQIIDRGAGVGPDGKNLKQGYKLVASGAYLHAALREETHANYDDVARSLQQVAQWQPEFSPIKADIERAKNGRHSAPGHGVVYVFAMVGRGPIREERMEIVSTVSLLIADRMITALGKQSLPPTIAPIKVPRTVKVPNSVDSVLVVQAGKALGRTQTLTDIGTMAVQQSDARLPEAVARAVVRRVVKKGIVYGAKEAIGTDKNQLASVAFDVAGVVWEATEAADTRCWGLLPDKIQVLRIELPAGEHELNLQAIGSGIQGSPESVRVTVADGRNSYVVANYPGVKAVGTINVSKP